MSKGIVNTTNSYQTGMFPFPKDEIPVSEKGYEWSRKWCEAMYSKHVSDFGAVLHSKQDEFISLRKYGAGNQDISKYQDILVGEEDSDGTLKGYMNIDWDIFSVMPKYKHIIQGIFEEQEHAIVATAVDPKSIEERDLDKLRKWFKGRYRPALEQIGKMAGAQQEPEWLPETVDELEIYQAVGGFKMAKEMEIEEALTYTFYISDWKETKRKMIDDFVDINCAAVKDYTDQYTRKAKIRYVDPLNLVMQYSRHWDHRNSEYGGEIIQESISNIRKNTDLTEDQLKNIAHFWNGRNLNKNISSWSDDDLQKDSGWAYDDFLIDVMDSEWFSVNQKNFTTRTNDRGQKFRYEEKSDKIYDTEKKKTTFSKFKVVYRAKWIIGTDFVYDYGLQYDVPRPGKKEVELSYKFYKLSGRSMMSVAAPCVDQMCLTWYKLQNAIAMAPNSGIAVEYTSLMNMKLGGDKMEPLEILALRRDTGDLFYKMTTAHGRQNVPGGMKPIQELQGGIGPQLNEFLTLLDTNNQLIGELTGINSVAAASSPNPNQSVGGSEMAIAATANALKPIYSGYIRLKELVARSSALRIQLLVRHDKEAYKTYIPVVGSAGTKILSVGTEAMDADYNIMIQAKPTQKRKELLMQAAMQAMQPDKSGNAAIEMKDFLFIERMIENGNDKAAEAHLNYISKKNKAQQEQLQRENMQLNSDNQLKAEQVKGEEARKTQEFLSGLKMKEQQQKYDLELRNKTQEQEGELKQLSVEKTIEMSLAQQQQQNTEVKSTNNKQTA